MRWMAMAMTAGAGVLMLSACGADERVAVHAVGSSTVYPFAMAIAEALAKSDPDLPRALIESTGTSEGIERFCAGVGTDTPDIVNASRRMTKAEFAECRANGVDEIIELKVGLDGIVFAAARDGLSMPLTSKIVYEALAAQPYGDAQNAAEWSSVDGSLPDQPIRIYGPPASSGTRDSLQDLVMMKGCVSEPAMSGLEATEPEKFAAVCGDLRADGAYIAQGEEDALTVDKVAGDKQALAVFDYSYFEENADKVKALPIDGIEASYETIASGRYPATQQLFVYVKAAHLETVPTLRAYLDQWAASWGKDGPLTAIGLVAASDRMLARNSEAIAGLTAMTELGLQ